MPFQGMLHTMTDQMTYGSPTCQKLEHNLNASSMSASSAIFTLIEMRSLLD